MEDIYKVIMICASKDDISNITKDIEIFAAETTSKIESLNSQVENIVATCSTNTDRIESLEATVEFLKQDQSINKLCISGNQNNNKNNHKSRKRNRKNRNSKKQYHNNSNNNHNGPHNKKKKTLGNREQIPTATLVEIFRLNDYNLVTF